MRKDPVYLTLEESEKIQLIILGLFVLFKPDKIPLG